MNLKCFKMPKGLIHVRAIAATRQEDIVQLEQHAATAAGRQHVRLHDV